MLENTAISRCRHGSVTHLEFLSLRGQRVQTVEQLAGSRFDWAHAFHELGRVLPYDVSLSAVTGAVAQPRESEGPSITPCVPP